MTSINAPRDDNFIPTALFEISGSNREFMPGQIDEATGRIITSPAGGSGTVTSVSVATANGFAGTVATATTTPAITLTTTITGILSGNGTAISAASTTGSGSVVLATSPVLVTPTLGVATATSINKLTITAPATSATLTIADGKTLTSSVTMTLQGGDASILSIAAAKTLTISKTMSFTAADDTGAYTLPTGTKTLLASDDTFYIGTTQVALNRASAALTLAGITLTTPDIGTPSAGVLTNATGLPAASVVAGTLGTGAYVMDTKLTVPQIINTNNAIAASGNAATVPITSRINTVTNDSAATLTITMATASAVDRQLSEVLVLDSSAAAQTITWVNTENGEGTAPVLSNGSTTLPRAALFQYNNATSKWRCLAS